MSMRDRQEQLASTCIDMLMNCVLAQSSNKRCETELSIHEMRAEEAAISDELQFVQITIS